MDENETAAGSDAAAPEANQASSEPVTDTEQADRRRANRRTPQRPAEADAVWTSDRPNPERYVPRPWVSSEERAAIGRAGRERAPRTGVGAVDLARTAIRSPS